MRFSNVQVASLIGCGIALAVAACSTPSPNNVQPAGSAGGPAAGAVGQPASTVQPSSGGSAVPPAKGGPSAPPAAPAPPPPRRYTLASGTVLAIQTSYRLSTETQVSGEAFQASLVDPIVDGDWVVAKKGADVEGLVVAATKGGKVKGRAELEVAVTAITLADGQRIPVTTALATKTAPSSAKKDAGKIAVTTGVGMAIGAIAGGGKGLAIGAAAGGAGGTALVLGTRGKPAEIPARSVLHFEVTGSVEIVERK
jgi:hypothetical protein